MEPKSMAATMFRLQQAIDNTVSSGNVEWRARHSESLAALAKLLPSGSGIDCGTGLVSIRAAMSEKIVLACSFHHMNEHGMYDGWTEHTITVRPSFDGLNITISGPNRNDIKDHLHEVYAHVLSTLVVWDSASGRWLEVSS